MAIAGGVCAVGWRSWVGWRGCGGKVVLGELVCVWGDGVGRLPVQVTAPRAGHPSHNASSP